MKKKKKNICNKMGGAVMKIFGLFLGILLSRSQAQLYENMTQLRSDILQGYDPDIIPLNNQSDVMKVRMQVQLYGIVEVDSVKGILTLVAGAYCQWYDQRLIWNPADYGGIQKIIIKQNAVWKPVIALGTPIEFQQLAKTWMRISVHANGLVLYGPGDVLQSSCAMSMRFWPFDKQVCKVVFFPVDYSADMLQLEGNGFLHFDIVKNTEWTLENYTYNVVGDVFSYQMVFILKLRRQAMFYVLSIILPLAGMFIISSLVFLLPQDSGERISYSITITLALAVFLTVVADEMPKSSEPMSLMCIFILLGVVNSLIIMVIVILNMRWYFKSDKTSPSSWQKRLARFTMCKFGNKVNNGFASENSPSKKTNRKEGNDLVFVRPREETEISEDEEITWKDVSSSVDILCFWAFLVLSIIQCLISNVYLSVASYYDESVLT